MKRSSMRKRRYDDELRSRRSSVRISQPPRILERRRSVFEGMDRFFSSVADELFECLVPGFFDSGRGKMRGKDLYFGAVLSPREAEQGGLFPVPVPVMETCPRCSRSAMMADLFCPLCSGYGRVQSERGFSLIIPPRVKHGAEIRLSMEDIGLRDVYLNVLVHIDPYLEEDW